MICLSGRRFAITNTDRDDRIELTAPATSLAQLTPGDEVIYRGRTAKVLAVDVYR